jgi:DNA-binding Lrp family transcriptional regulator
MDNADLLILKELVNDCTISAKVLAKKLNGERIDLSERAVRKRVKRLYDNGIIKAFTILLDPDIAGKKNLRLVLVRFRNAKNFIQRLNDYKKYIANSPYCICAVRIRGDLDWAHLKTFSNKELADEEEDIFRSMFGDIIEDYRSYDAEMFKDRTNVILTDQEIRNYLLKFDGI